MRVSRIRKFKKSGEITIILTPKEAQALSYRLYYDKKECFDKNSRELLSDGAELGKKIWYEGLNKLW